LPSRTLLSSGAEPSGADLYLRDEALTTYADGLALWQIGTATSKLSFFHVMPKAQGDDKGREQREIVHTVALPTRALIEALATLLKGLRDTSPSILIGFDAERTALFQALENLGGNK